MLGEPPRADRPAPAPLQVPAVQKPDLPTTTAGSATTPQGMDALRNGPMDAAAGGPTLCRRPRERGRRRTTRLDQLHFWVPVTTDVDGVPPALGTAVNVSL